MINVSNMKLNKVVKKLRQLRNRNIEAHIKSTYVEDKLKYFIRLC